MKKTICGISLLLAVLLTFMGCRQTPGKEASSRPTGMEPGPWGAYSDPITLKLCVPSNMTQWPGAATGDYSYEDNVWTQAWLDEFNIRTEVLWEAVDSIGDYATKMNLAITSKDLPDIIVTADYSQFTKLQAAGLLQPLDDVLETYAYDLLKENIFKDGGKNLERGRVGGKLYGIPLDGNDYRTRQVLIRADWMKELKLSAPKTMDDVIAIGKKFVSAGKASYALPLYNKLIDGFGDIVAVSNSVGAYPRIWMEKDGNLAYGSVQPEMKSMLKIYADLFKGKYIDKAFASLDSGAVATQITSGQVGVLPSDYWVITWPLNTLWDAKKEVDWNVYPVMPSASYRGDFKIQGPAAKGKMVGVKAGYAYPEVLIKLMNHRLAMLDDPETAETDVFHSAKVDNETISFFQMSPLAITKNDPMTNYNSQINVTKAVDNNFDESLLVSPHDKLVLNNIRPYFLARESGATPSGAAWSNYKMFYGDNSAFGVYNKYIKDNLVIFSADNGYQSETMVRQWGTLVKLEDQYITDIISGKKGVDTGFNEFVKSWNNLGGKKITEEMAAWYKAQN